jgi:hypothetical protein
LNLLQCCLLLLVVALISRWWLHPLVQQGQQQLEHWAMWCQPAPAVAQPCLQVAALSALLLLLLQLLMVSIVLRQRLLSWMLMMVVVKVGAVDLLHCGRLPVKPGPHSLPLCWTTLCLVSQKLSALLNEGE